MTQEEKARAYDKALEKARARYSKEPTDGYVGYTNQILKELFPTLSESEDENLKNKSGYYKAGKFWKASTLWNATKDKIPQRVPNRYILQGCTWNIGSLQEFANEVKNVQEVSLDYPIILDMNGNILDGAHRVVKAYLEGKDIDIVYLGDDEWPEPDYDEEKAVKESEDERVRKWLVNHFRQLSCQEVGGIAVDDIIAYLEKQKETSINWMKSDNVKNPDKPYIDKVGMFYTTDGRMCYASEIEKQRDENAKDSFERGIKVGMIRQQKEQKPVDEEELSKFCEANFNAGKRVVLNNPEEYGLQKHAEWSEEDSDNLERVDNYLWMLDDYVGDDCSMPQGKTDKIRGNIQEVLSPWLKALPERFNLQPRTEWSEEDERKLQKCIKIVERWEEDYDIAYAPYSDMLKSLRPQPKQEWTEEEKQKLNRIYSIIGWAMDEHAFSSCKKLIGDKEGVELQDFLRSIAKPEQQPSWKPSEEQMEALRECGECKRCIKKLYEDLKKRYRYGTC